MPRDIILHMCTKNYAQMMYGSRDFFHNDGQMDSWTDGWTGRRTDGWLDRQADGWLDKQTDGQLDGWKM